MFGILCFNAGGGYELISLKWVKSRRGKKKEERKKKNKGKKVGENNGPLRFRAPPLVATQAAWTKNEYQLLLLAA